MYSFVSLLNNSSRLRQWKSKPESSPVIIIRYYNIFGIRTLYQHIAQGSKIIPLFWWNLNPLGYILIYFNKGLDFNLCIIVNNHDSCMQSISLYFTNHGYVLSISVYFLLAKIVHHLNLCWVFILQCNFENLSWDIFWPQGLLALIHGVPPLQQTFVLVNHLVSRSTAHVPPVDHQSFWSTVKSSGRLRHLLSYCL